MFDTLAAQVALMVVLMAAAMISAALLIGDLAQTYAVGFWGRRAEDRGAGDRRAAYRGPERRRRDPAAADLV